MRLDVVADIMWYSLPDIGVLLLFVIMISFVSAICHLICILFIVYLHVYIFDVLYVIPCDVRFCRSCIIFSFLSL